MWSKKQPNYEYEYIFYWSMLSTLTFLWTLYIYRVWPLKPFLTWDRDIEKQSPFLELG